MIFYKVYQWDLTVHISVLALLKLGDTRGKSYETETYSTYTILRVDASSTNLLCSPPPFQISL